MIQKLIDEINIDLDSMRILVSDIELLINEVDNNPPNNIQKTALGGFTAQFYNGVENILKRIHKYLKIELPNGDDWHITILNRFSQESDFEIPLKFNKELIVSLTNLRRFRHYFFHGYSHNLNWEILVSGVKDIAFIFDNFENVLKLFLNSIDN